MKRIDNQQGISNQSKDYQRADSRPSLHLPKSQCQKNHECRQSCQSIQRDRQPSIEQKTIQQDIIQESDEHRKIQKVMNQVSSLIIASQSLQDFKKALFELVAKVIINSESSTSRIWLNVVQQVILPEDKLLALAIQGLEIQLEDNFQLQEDIPLFRQSELWQQLEQRSLHKANQESQFN